MKQPTATLEPSIRNAVISLVDKDFILARVFSEIKKVVTAQQFDVWFSGLKILSITDARITFLVPNTFVREWLYNNYADLFSGVIYKLLNSSREVVLSVESEVRGLITAFSLPKAEDALLGGVSPETFDSSPLNKYYGFENFIVGSCNRLAHAASVAVSESPGQAYNPLFIHGASGLGKTHLLHAISNTILSKHDTKVVYLPCDQFVNHYISTIKSNSWESFRNLYRHVDVLLLDDVQFFENVQGCREEFFHTFNALYNAKKQIVLTSDCPPDFLKSLEERLISRFKWGLLCSIDSPNVETRIAIISKKASLLSFNLSYEAASYIAENTPGNIRELEGIITRLNKETKLGKCDIPLETVKKVVQELSGRKKSVSIEAILMAVSERFNVSVSQLQSKCRTRSLILPRQIVMYLSRRLTNMSLVEIGGYIGGRDHSTIIHADEKISKLSKKDKNLLFILQRLESEL
ncbi:MAG: chromosomal replication initiator protein DnaA [Planctomycetota bacterium]